MKQLFTFCILLFSALISMAQWSQLSETFNGNTVRSLKACNGYLLAGTGSTTGICGVFRSNDNGLTWTFSNTGLGNTTTIHTMATIGTVVFGASFSEGVFKSLDTGVTWTNIFGNIPNVGYYSLGTQGTTIVVGTDYGEIYRSTNLGVSWTKVDSASHCNAVNTVNSNSTNFFVGTCSSVLTSTNQGSTWTAANTGLNNYSIANFVIKGPYVFLTDGSRIFKSSNNGGNWVSALNNLSINPFKWAFGVSGIHLLVGTQAGVYLTNDYGQNWIYANWGIYNHDAFAFDTINNYLFAATQVGVFRIDSSQITAIKPINEMHELSFKIFPNPANDHLTLEFEQEVFSTSPIEINIINVLGDIEYVSTLSQPKENISIDALSTGVHFVQINSSKGIGRKMFIKQ